MWRLFSPTLPKVVHPYSIQQQAICLRVVATLGTALPESVDRWNGDLYPLVVCGCPLPSSLLCLSTRSGLVCNTYGLRSPILTRAKRSCWERQCLASLHSPTPMLKRSWKSCTPSVAGLFQFPAVFTHPPFDLCLFVFLFFFCVLLFWF